MALALLPVEVCHLLYYRGQDRVHGGKLRVGNKRARGGVSVQGL